MGENPKKPVPDDELALDFNADLRFSEPLPDPTADASAGAILGAPSPEQVFGAAQKMLDDKGVKPAAQPKQPPAPPVKQIPPPPAKPKASPRPPPAPVPPDPKKPLKVKGGMLGKILVDNGFLTLKQRGACLAIQSQPENVLPFGEIAIERGFISREVLNRVLEAQKTYVADVHREQSRSIPLPATLTETSTERRRDAGQMLAWLSSTLNHQASDLHLMVGKSLVLRHHGKLLTSKDNPIEAASVESLLKSVLTDDECGILERDRSLVKCINLSGGARARACIFHHLHGINGVFRLIPDSVPSLVELHLPPTLGKFTTYAQGLVLVTGPIGSGKTTTLAALVDIINQERHQHIITIEDPIEFVHKNNCSLITQRQVGAHTDGFAMALRSALREDPDVIVVGQMHDRETAQLAVTAAETGHLVFATLHTQSAIRSINRVLDLFPAEDQGQVRTVLAESLRGVVSQRLVPRADAPGRVPVVELLFVTPAIRNLIREQKVHQLRNAMHISRNVGNLLMEDHAAELLKKKLISDKRYEAICAQ